VENHFLKSKTPWTHILMVLHKITKLTSYIFITKNQLVDWLVIFSLCLWWKNYYIHFQYVIVFWKNIVQKSKRPCIHFLISFNANRIMIGYILKSSKINIWNDWWWLLGVSTQTIFIFSFTMSFISIKKYCWLYISINQNQCMEWLVTLFGVSRSHLLYSLSICYWFFQK